MIKLFENKVVDFILDKISDEGIASLTNYEMEYLKKYSEDKDISDIEKYINNFSFKMKLKNKTLEVYFDKNHDKIRYNNEYLFLPVLIVFDRPFDAYVVVDLLSRNSGVGIFTQKESESEKLISEMKNTFKDDEEYKKFVDKILEKTQLYLKDIIEKINV